MALTKDQYQDVNIAIAKIRSGLADLIEIYGDGNYYVNKMTYTCSRFIDRMEIARESHLLGNRRRS